MSLDVRLTEDYEERHSANITHNLTLATHQAQFEVFNAPNGWGKWENFLLFLARLLQACKDNPKAKVEVSR